MDLAYKGEKLFHGNPSGVDNAVSFYGDLLRFKKDVSNGSMVMQGVQSSPLSLLLIDSMLPKNTAAMIQKVAQRRERFEECIHYLFDSIQALVTSVVKEVELHRFNSN